MLAELQDLWYPAHEAFAATQGASGLPVAYPNTQFDDSPHEAYLAVATLSANPLRIALGNCHQYLWVLQTTVYVRDDTDESFGALVADALLESFPVLHQFEGPKHTFEVQTPFHPAVPNTLPGWFVLPVSSRVYTTA